MLAELNLITILVPLPTVTLLYDLNNKSLNN